MNSSFVDVGMVAEQCKILLLFLCVACVIAIPCWSVASCFLNVDCSVSIFCIPRTSGIRALGCGLRLYVFDNVNHGIEFLPAASRFRFGESVETERGLLQSICTCMEPKEKGNRDESQGRLFSFLSFWKSERREIYVFLK